MWNFNFFKYDIGKLKKLKAQHILAKILAKILRYLTTFNEGKSAARWQHDSQICFATFI
jgi:hypothetical protein